MTPAFRLELKLQNYLINLLKRFSSWRKKNDSQIPKYKENYFESKYSFFNFVSIRSAIMSRKNYIGFLIFGVLLFLGTIIYVNYKSAVIKSGASSTPYLAGMISINLIYIFKRKKLVNFYKEYDERERILLYKTITITTLLFLTLFLLITDIRSLTFLGIQIKELYGYFVVPIYLFILGLVGLVHSHIEDY